MAATQYQVLYRYINESTNTPITNDMNSEYEPIHELYSDPYHNIFSIDEKLQIEALDEQQQMISSGNNSSNVKNNMLFAYNGTKKIGHGEWVKDATGYVVRDWKQLDRKKIGNLGDFTKDFTTLNMNSPEEGGTVVCKSASIKKYFKDIITIVEDNSKADAGTSTNPYYTASKITQLVNDATFFSVPTPTYVDSKRSGLYSSSGSYTNYYIGPVAIGGNDMKKYSGSGISAGKTVFGQPDNDNGYLYSKVQITQDNIETITIPGHYEESNESPYLIIDTYKKIQLSPWFVNCTCGSLESAISKAKMLIEALGIENVKVIKLVPFDQFIKIK